MKASTHDRRRLGQLVGLFLGAMHHHDAGRTLPILHGAQLSTPQLAVLEFVRIPRTVSVVAEHVGLSRPATSQMISKLVRQKFVRRLENALDRRERRIVLAASGGSLLARIAAARAARFDASLALLSPAVARRLEEVLGKAVHELDRTRAKSAESAEAS